MRRAHMAYKPKHVVDLESGAIVSAVIHPADRGDTTTLATTLDDVQAKLCAVRDKEGAPGIDEPFALVADKGYHSRNVLKDLPDSCTSRISEPAHKGRLCWHGDRAARDAVYGNRGWLKSEKGKALLRARGERVERSFAHCLDRGGMRRVHLRGLGQCGEALHYSCCGVQFGDPATGLVWFWHPQGLGRYPCSSAYCPNWQPEPAHLGHLSIW